MEVQKTDNQKSNTDQVIVDIDVPDSKRKQFHQADFDIPPSPNPTTTKTLRRLKFSKPRSRFEEISYPLPARVTVEPQELHPSNTHKNTSSTVVYDDDDEDDDVDDDDDEDEEEYEGMEEENGEGEAKGKSIKKRKIKLNKRAVIEWTLFLIITTCLVCSLTLKSLKDEKKWGLEIWKWCLMVLVSFCGRLVSGWVVGILVFLIERNFMLRERVLYFVYGLRKSFQNCVWLGLVLVAWMIMFPNVHKQNKFLKKVFRALITVLIGATIWLLKILFVKVLASSFHVATFFDRMKESVFHHYILETLSGPPLDEEERELPHRRLQVCKTLPARLRGSYPLSRSKRYGSRKIDMERLRKLSQEGRATAWSVKRLISHVMYSGLSTISRTVDDFGKAESEMTSEWEARNCAQRTFKNVAKPGAKYIEEEDLLRFLRSDEVHTIFPLFEGAIGTGRITKSSFRNWVVYAYVERKALAHSLNDTKTAVHQLHKLASAIVVVVITVISLLVMGLATTKVIFVVTSQLLLVGFMFQNMCKTIFESIIFVFVMHPFDVGDRCVVDGVQVKILLCSLWRLCTSIVKFSIYCTHDCLFLVRMLVEEMNILTTVFLRYDNEKIYYPNAILLTKPISNFRRSPDMADSVDFTIDVSTSTDDVTALKKAIQGYIESKPKYWNPKHSVLVKEIVDVDKMKMSLCVQHTMNHQNYGEKSNRRSELVFELKKIFENLGIKYHLLPQEVHVTQFNVNNGGMGISS